MEIIDTTVPLPHGVEEQTQREDYVYQVGAAAMLILV